MQTYTDTHRNKQYNLLMDMKEYEFYVTLQDGEVLSCTKGRTASEAKSAVEAQYSNEISNSYKNILKI